ncbi:MAG: 50S ribosomal protein L17 [Candidatus Pacebacteria bacterium]|nr:50S ribosomal protein L17 [Candidatus Paceibacterota bacterium]
MRHQHKGRTLGRPKNQRTALLRSLARSLIIHERISTTEAKAKELRPFIEEIITHGRVDTVANRRLVNSRLDDEEATKKIFTAIGPRYATRPGGYTRIIKRSATATDGRKTAYIALV